MSSSVMAWYKGQKVYLAIPDNSLLFDGTQFVRPADAKWVWLTATTEAVFLSPAPLPINEFEHRVELTQEQGYVCQVIGTGITIADPPEVIAIPDPNDGECVCGVTCSGTDLQYVTVTYV